MRLLNVKTRQIEEFLRNPPPYAILSHRWGDREVTFQDIKSGWPPDLPVLSSWSKLEGCCLQAEKDNLSYIWVDTCCIDKTNSTELSEAINSMFDWYKDAARCYAYLSDVHSSDVLQGPQSEFRASSWFTRGWTLQELLAPKEVYFYNSKWKPIGTKKTLSSIIEEVTRIQRNILRGWADLDKASVAQRMSWAANRVTTRIEDVAYCLLGLFKVNIDMRYGEKERAFGRLQLEIMKIHGDHSILAWGFTSDRDTTDGNALAVHGAALATSPVDFANSGRVVPCSGYGQTTNSFDFQGGSLRMQVPLVRNSAGRVFGLLNCHHQSDEENLIGIPLHAISADKSTGNYFRPAGSRPSLFPRNRKEKSSRFPWNRKEKSSLVLIRISGDVQASDPKSVTRSNCFYIDGSAAMVELIEVMPGNRWMKDTDIITTSNEAGTKTREDIFLRFRSVSLATDGGSDDFVVVLVFERQRYPPRATGHVMILSRHDRLDELAEEFEVIGNDLYGQQSCSNGQAGVTVLVKSESISEQGGFVLELTKFAETPGVEVKPVNATQRLAMLRKQREDEALRRQREDEALRRQREDEVLRRQREDEALRRQREDEALFRSPYREALRRQREDEALRRPREDEALRRQPEGEALFRNPYREQELDDERGEEVSIRNPEKEILPSADKPDIVVGIHLGPKYSAVSWATNAGTRETHLITDWPNPNVLFTKPNSERVPTMMSYQDYPLAKWGYEAEVTGTASHLFPLMLEPHHDSVIATETAMMLDRIHKTPQEVKAHYLGFLWSHTNKHIRLLTPRARIPSITVVITVPATWSDVAIERIRKAAEAVFPGNITLVREPVAAALAVVRDTGGPLQKDDVFIVCDAGESTVDLVSYEVRELYPLEIQQCAIGDGAFCGSADIDFAFEKFVRSKIGDSQYESIREGNKKAMMREFDQRVKRNFAGDDKRCSVDLRGVEDNAEMGIEDETILLSRSSLLTIFDPVCTQIVSLVEKQIQQVEDRRLGVKVILLVGSFGKSRYLHHRLKNAEEVNARGIQVLRNTRGRSSICRGATMWGLERAIIHL